jgi:uracil-DNA glycosylase
MSQAGHAEDTNPVRRKDSHGTITHAEKASCSWFQHRSIKRVVRCKQFCIRVGKVASKFGEEGGPANG